MSRGTLLSVVRFGLLGLLLGAAAGPAGAQGLILPTPVPLPRPGPRPVQQPLSVRSQKIQMQLSDGVLKVDVEQIFQNPNSAPFEGTYLFPLPEGAAVSSFRLTIGQEPTEGKLLNVDEAKRVYESYVRRNVDPAILEYVGRNAFQARVFPIPAGGERQIFLTYSQPLEFSNGIYKAVYPLTSERLTGQVLADLALSCTLKTSRPLKSIYSPTHEIQVKRESDTLARATYEAKDVRANRDFILYYSISDKAFGLNSLAHRRAGEPGYLMLMLAPKREASSTEVQPKDVVFVFDTSGSMQGAKMEQARKSLVTMLGALNEQDRFTVVRFSSDVNAFKETVVPATAENRAAAKTFVEGFKAVGGTAIDDALATGLGCFPKAEERRGRAPYLIFMTDGLPTIGETEGKKILEHAGNAAPKDLRLFSFGVGADVNTLLLDRLARDHRGAADYVALNEDLESRIGSFYQKISDPVLANVKVSLAGSGAQFTEVYPKQVGDLFAGTQLLMVGRYGGTGKATVTLTGDVNGAAQKFTYDVTLPERELGQEFLPKLWGSRKIGELLEQIRLNGEEKELKDEVIRLSKEYGILTPYTAYLVEEPNLPAPTQLGQQLGFRFNRLADDAGVADRRGLTPNGNLGGLGAGGGRGGGVAPGGAGAPGSAGVPGSFGGAAARPAGGDKGVRGPAGTPTAPARPASGPQDAPALRAMKEKERLESLSLEARTKLGKNSYFDAYGRDLSRKEAQLQQIDGFRRSTGLNAVEASKRLKDLNFREQAQSDVELKRTIEGRQFQMADGGWIDDSVTPKMQTVTVKYGSNAYFQLVGARREWARFLSLGRQVAFRTGKSTIVVVDEQGKEKLTPAEMKALEK